VEEELGVEVVQGVIEIHIQQNLQVVEEVVRQV
jgi:hypothetical protein